MTRGFIDGEYQDGEIRGLVLLCGRRGFGKTTEMDRLLSLCTGGRIFFDTLSKHAHVFTGYRVICETGELEAYLRLNRGRRFSVLYQPRGGSLDLHFRAVLMIARAFGWMIIAVDEVDKLCGARWGDSRMPPELYHLVDYGRHEKISMIMTARRPSSVAKGIRSESELRLFRMKAEIAECFEEDIGEDAVRRVPTLEKFEYLLCRDDEEPVLSGGARAL